MAGFSKNLSIIKGIGQRICKAREDKGLQQKDVAKMLGYKSRTSISKLETEEKIPTVDVILQLSEILDVDLFWLITGKQNPDKISRIIDPINRTIKGFEDVLQTEEIRLQGNLSDANHTLDAIKSEFQAIQSGLYRLDSNFLNTLTDSRLRTTILIEMDTADLKKIHAKKEALEHDKSIVLNALNPTKKP
jgi:transcriptional regulator with XRE-family HTH domain